eukprot:g31541.t1
MHRIGFANKNELVNCLSELPVGINDHLITLYLQLAKNQQAVVEIWKELKTAIITACEESISYNTREHERMTNQPRLRQQEDESFLCLAKQHQQSKEESSSNSKAGIETAIRHVQNEKAVVDGIPREVFKLEEQSLPLISIDFLRIWDQEEIPVNLRDSAIAIAFKKGDKMD